jgi:phosphoribosylaminoimidazolecarboxamide formyltransferase/IMP cyclohydrolase
MSKVRRALLSVHDKRNLVALATTLSRHGVEILSTGGTAEALKAAGIPIVPVSQFTGAPEILEGRVKTLHPLIHGGLLGRPIDHHEQEMAANGIRPIDLVAVNLYPFGATIRRPNVKFAEAIENIDIGGPSMIRSAAKNHERVTVLVDPNDYAAVMDELDRSGGEVSGDTRLGLAKKAFACTAAYDGEIASYLSALPGSPLMTDVEPAPAPSLLPATYSVTLHRERALRYGENPHQEAAFYRMANEPAWPTVGFADVLQGKELSYNNLLDLDAALQLIGDLDLEQPAAVIVKHNNACGAALGASAAEAFRLAREVDPVSAYGGIVAVSRPVDEALATELSEIFLEAVIAPDYSPAALALLGKKKNLRLLKTRGRGVEGSSLAVRSIGGGFLVQTSDRPEARATLAEVEEAKVATDRSPTPAERAALGLAWRVVKHVKSNAIVLANEHRIVGVGAGQMSRVDSVRLAVEKAVLPIAGTALASDAFFPFRDGVDAAAKAGVKAIVQPGGSVRDSEVIAAANEAGIAMLLTGRRHFRH